MTDTLNMKADRRLAGGTCPKGSYELDPGGEPVIYSAKRGPNARVESVLMPPVLTASMDARPNRY